MDYDVTVKSTSITIYPGSSALDPLEPLLNLLTYEDEFAEQTKTLGYIYDESQDLLYLHKGVDIDYIRRLLVDVNIKQDPFHKYKEMNFEYEEIVAPRNNEQVDVINFIAGLNHHQSNINASQIFVIQPPGSGKTFCSGVGMCKFGAKTLVIMHRDSLRKQWYESLYRMNGMSDREVHEISSSQELYDIAYGNIQLDYDVYLLTHATFRAGVKRIGNLKDIAKITENLYIGMKIVDEAHLEFRDTIMMDFMFNVRRNLYLTATSGRSSKDENSIFKHVFSKAVFYKPSSLLTENTPKRWVNYVSIMIDTKCKPGIYQYRVAGGKGMNSASYGKWVIAYDKKQTHFRVCAELIKQVFNNDPHAKIIVFMPLIELCDSAQDFFNKTFHYDEEFDYELDISTINSQNSKAENERNKKADVIVTTIASAGTGTDIPGITDIICCSPFVSQITAEQVFGRIRYIPKECHYFDIVDQSVPLDKFWWKARSKKLKHLAKKVEHLVVTDDDVKEQSAEK